jgi:hypothetical protein
VRPLSPPCVALNPDLDLEKERGFVASSLHRELRAADAGLTGLASELPSLMITQRKRDTAVYRRCASGWQSHRKGRGSARRTARLGGGEVRLLR